MCGIAGVLVGPSGASVTEDEVLTMAAAVEHRGPDGHGWYVSPRVGLASTRLSIVDVHGGFQPLCNEQRDVWLAHNGEIYNHVELREALRALGHRFATGSDSEVIVHAYEEYGPEAWARLNGQFAIALWDRRTEALWLVRDPFGIHPLHVAEVDGAVVFASEAKAILAGGRISAAPDPQGLIDVFVRWAPSPPRTVFDGIREVRPGTALRFDSRLGSTEHRYWVPPAPGPQRSIVDEPPLADSAAALHELMEEAVRLRLRADVPVAAYLSGGLDSTYIAALARRLHAGRLATFGIRFDDPLYDETATQRGAAALLGTDHHELLCTAADLGAALPSAVLHAEQPLLRTAPVAMLLLSRLVHEQGFKVALTGEGADEWFAGYAIFKEDRVRRFWGRVPGSAMRPALLARIHPEIGRDRARATKYWGSFFGTDIEHPDHALFSHLPRWRTSAWTTRILSPDILAGGSVDRSLRAVEDELPDDWSSWSPLARAQALEVQTFLSPYLLATQGDRVGLGHGVELRYPFLDPAVAAFATRLPDRHKLLGLHDKRVLRRAAAAVLPAALTRQPKRPFRAPITRAVLAGTSVELDALLADDAIRRLGLADPAVARHLLDRARGAADRAPSEREAMATIGLVTLQLWGSQFLERQAGGGTVAAARLRGRPPRVRELHPDGEPFVAAGVR